MTGLGWVVGLILLIGAGRIIENESFTHVWNEHVMDVGMRAVADLEIGKRIYGSCKRKESLKSISSARHSIS